MFERKIHTEQYTEKDAEKDVVNQPSHYQGGGGLEAVDVVEAFGLGHHVGDAVIYILRAGKKGDALEDYKKAIWWLTRHCQLTYGHDIFVSHRNGKIKVEHTDTEADLLTHRG